MLPRVILDDALVAKLNEAIEALSENGKLAEIAAKYNLQNDLIPNIGKEQ